MFRKALLSTLTATILATSAFSNSSAYVSDFGKEVPPVSRRLSGKDVTAGLVLGAAVAILGALASDRKDVGFRGRKQRRHHDVSRHDEDECFDKPVRKFSHSRGKTITVGFRTICP
jgi:hypothetical protein